MSTLYKTAAYLSLIMGITGICVSETNAKAHPNTKVGTYGCPSTDEVHKYLNSLSDLKKSKSKNKVFHSHSTDSDWVLDEAGKYDAGSQFKEVSLKAEVTPDICTYNAITEDNQKIKFIFRDAYLSPSDVPTLQNVPVYNPFSDTVTEENFYTYEGKK
jgi:hypothetical protein